MAKRAETRPAGLGEDSVRGTLVDGTQEAPSLSEPRHDVSGQEHDVRNAPAGAAAAVEPGRGVARAIGSALRSGRWKLHLALVIVPVIALVIALSFVTSCVGRAFSDSVDSGKDVVVSRDAKEQFVKADVDTEGLREIAAAIEEMEQMPTDGKVNWIWADKLEYWDQTNTRLSWNSWPVPNGSVHPNRRCYNSTVAHMYILATGDWSVTSDSGMVECAETYHHWHPGPSEGNWHNPTMWPWYQFDMWHERVNLHSTMLAYDDPNLREDGTYWDDKWNEEHCRRLSDQEAWARIKKSLAEGNPMYGGCGCMQEIYRADGGTLAPAYGHAFVWYKYDPVEHVFYAKDSCYSGGPSVTYPEHGGRVDPFELILGENRTPGQIFWMDDEDRKKVETPPSPDAIRALEKAELQMPDPPYVDKHYPLYASPAVWGTSYERALATEDDLRFASETSTISGGNDDGPSFSTQSEEPVDGGWAVLAQSVPPGGGGLAWVRALLLERGMSPPGSGSPAEWYWRAVDGQFGAFGTTRTDPTLSSLREGMLIGVPSVPSDSESERLLGRVGVYVGNDTVAYDDGVVRLVDVSEFVATSELVAPVAWWYPPSGELSSYASDGTAPALSAKIPSPSSVPGLDVAGVAAEMASCLAESSVDVGMVSGVRLLGQTEVAGSDGTQVVILGYVLSLADGEEHGFDVFCDGDGQRVVPASCAVADSQSLYDTDVSGYIPADGTSTYGALMGEFLGIA